jgi:hypothetical protein
MFGAERLSMLLRKAQKGLRTLKKANAGDVDNMEKVLKHTYARAGRRKADILLVSPQFSHPNLRGLLQTIYSPVVAYDPRISCHSASQCPACH